MLSRSSLRKPKFVEPQNFSLLNDSGKWYCNVCSSPILAQRNSMSAQAALKHEKGGTHKQKVREREAWDPQPDVDAWMHGADYDDLFESRLSERTQHVDQLRDIIPFWRQQVEAAEHGETLRYEEFLNTLGRKMAEDDEPAWEVPMPDWALDPVGIEEQSSETGHAQVRGTSSEGSLDREAFMFVERIAKMNSVSAKRKKRLHKFYKISTKEKLERIQELIDVLRVTT